MPTRSYLYRGFQIGLDLYPKEDGSYAWAYTIGDGDPFGLGPTRQPTFDEAAAEAGTAAEARVDFLLAHSA